MEQHINTKFLHHQDVNAVLLEMYIYVDGMQCSVLIDTECSQSIVDAEWCQCWKKARVDVRTIAGTSRACCVGVVTIFTNKGDSAKISVLVVCDKPLEFDLLLGIDVIRVLGGIIVGPIESVQISDGKVIMCAPIFVNEPDFTATFNHQSRTWTISWK